MIFHAKTPPNQTLNTTSGQLTDILGLALTLPASTAGNSALVTLNVPNPYATGNDFPGGMFAFKVNGNTNPSLPIAAFTSFNKDANLSGVPPTQSAGRVPVTLVAAIPLSGSPITVTAAWASIRKSKVVIETPATLSAVI